MTRLWSFAANLRTASRRWLVGALLLAGALLGAAVVLRNGTNRLPIQGLSLDVPSAWSIHADLTPTTGMGQTLAIIGTLPWGPCAPYDQNCHYRERLSPHEVQVEISRGIMPGGFCAYAKERPDLEPRTDGIRVTETHYFRVDGRPAIMTMYALETTDYYLSTGWRKWEIAAADTPNELYRIFAIWRGPDDDDLVAALDRLVASIKIETTGYGKGVPDCAHPFPSPVSSSHK